MAYSPPMEVEVEAVTEVTDELVEACGRLLPQLSASAAPVGAGELGRIVGHQGISLLVARTEEGIVGMLTLVSFPLASGLRARIEDVVVDEGARGQGVGTALTTAALELARRLGARNVDLTSRPSRVAANRLYQRLGFQRRERLPLPAAALVARGDRVAILGRRAEVLERTAGELSCVWRQAAMTRPGPGAGGRRLPDLGRGRVCQRRGPPRQRRLGLRPLSRPRHAP